ncbi:subtilisin-like protein [Sarocladium strictum]
MRGLVLFPLGALLGSSLATNHVVHERRHKAIDHQWDKREQLHKDEVLPIRIGLKQSNLEHADRWLMEVSDPNSSKFGKHWTAEEVLHAFKPSHETVQAVHSWLNESGIHPDRHQLSTGLGWLQFDASVDEAERLFQTTYHVFEHRKSSTAHIAFPGNSLGIVEYTPESYLGSDLDLFFETYERDLVGKRPVLDSIDGGYLYDTEFNDTNAFTYLGEPSLDLQYAMALVDQQEVTLYQVGDLAESNMTSFNNFLDAIDASYCTYDGGDDQEIDAVYPDPYPGPHSYQGKEDCGTFQAAKVISTSYAYNEVELPAAYEIRQCHEYLKLGLMGSTIVYSSGDYGVEFDGGGCLNPDGSQNDGTSGAFVPTFPGTCPYVLAAGATQIKNGTYNVDKAIRDDKQVEVVMELYLVDGAYVGNDVPPGADVFNKTIFSSSGGFSNVFPIPSYQQHAVREYMEKYAPDYPGQYNNTGMVRGFPDIAANGAWYSIAVFGELSQAFGTSCAAPVISALLTIINGERMRRGKGSIGFINPVLYSHPHVLKDVVEGQNPGCGTNGFSAVPGWDPTTGLGTPNFPKMLELFLSLP